MITEHSTNMNDARHERKKAIQRHSSTPKSTIAIKTYLSAPNDSKTYLQKNTKP